MTSEHLLSANLTTREYVFVLPNAKNLSRENNSVYSNTFMNGWYLMCGNKQVDGVIASQHYSILIVYIELTKSIFQLKDYRENK